MWWVVERPISKVNLGPPFSLNGGGYMAAPYSMWIHLFFFLWTLAIDIRSYKGQHRMHTLEFIALCGMVKI